MRNSGLTFAAGVTFEVALLLIAFGWGWFFSHSVLADLNWSLRHLLIGVVAAFPAFLFFLWTLHSRLGFMVRHRELMYSLLDRVFQGWSILQLAVISACAGFCEEALFRGAIQSSLAERIGPLFSLLCASLLFGASHLITWTYGIIALLIGLYLGWLYAWTGNLLTPMVAHAAYDLVALAWLVQTQRRNSPGNPL